MSREQAGHLGTRLLHHPNGEGNTMGLSTVGVTSWENPLA